jgi:hypothetical protein
MHAESLFIAGHIAAVKLVYSFFNLKTSLA